MKKLYAILFSVFLAAEVLNAQITITTAPDFTVTDLQGNSFNLFTALNQGKYVVIDFFFTTCGPCQAAAPHFKTAFQNYGCNNGNVIFISIDNGDSKAQCQTYENTYVGAGGPPMVSGTGGGGDAVVSAYKPAAFPTFILIAPNKQIVEQDMWPISNAASFNPYLSSHGLSYSACATGLVEMASPFHFEIYPNPVSSVLNIRSNNNTQIFSYKVFDFMGKEVLAGNNESGVEGMSVVVSPLVNGFYFAEIMTSEGVLVQKFNKQ